MGVFTGSVWSRTCSLVLASLMIAGPALQAGPAFASGGTTSPPVSAEATAESAAAPAPTPTVVRELVERRAETATHWLMSDGTVRAEITQAPMRFMNEVGEWVDIDTSLVPAAESGAFESAATSLAVTMDAQELSEAPVTIGGAGYSVGMDMLGVAESARIILGDATRYLDVAQDTDLEYRVLDVGVKETLILKSADAPSAFDFVLDLEGLQVRRDPFGGYALYRPGESEPELELGSLVVFDSSQNEAGEPAYCENAQMTVVERGDGSVLVHYDVSRAWLEDRRGSFR